MGKAISDFFSALGKGISGLFSAVKGLALGLFSLLGQILTTLLRLLPAAAVVISFVGLLDLFQQSNSGPLPLEQIILIAVLALILGVFVRALQTDAYSLPVGHSSPRTNPPWLFYLMGAVFVFCLLVLPLFIPASSDRLLPPQVLLILFLIGGVIALVIVMSALTDVFSRFNLTSKDEALGLPTGSIRALIALLLIIIFAIFILYMFGAMRGNSTTIRDLTLADVSAIMQTKNVTDRQQTAGQDTPDDLNDDRFRVEYVVEPSQAAQTIGGQILTTLSTLTAAVAAFYFGTRSVEVARGEKSTNILDIAAVNPNSGKTGSTIAFKITGKNFDVGSVELHGDSDTIQVMVVSKSKESLDCVIPDNAKVGTYQIFVKNKDGTEDSGISFQVTS
jgi:hypothetical protein